MKIKISVIGLLCLFSMQGFSQQTFNGFSMPESVTSNGKRFFVSNQGQDVFSKDGDGFISEISADGKLIELKFAPTKDVLNTPKGITIEGNVLYVADLERVVGFDINTRKTVFELEIPNAVILNDICRLEKGFIAVTETVSGNIYKINTGTRAYEIIGNIPTINGISFHEKTNQLAVCTNGKNLGQGAVYIKKGNGNFEELPNISNGFFDGIEWLDDSHLIISDWVTFPTIGFGKLWTYDLKKKQANFLFTEESTADIYYDHVTNKIWMPQMFQNKVVIIDKEQLSKEAQNKFNKLYNFGVIDAFIGGLYKGTLPIKQLKLKGDFGLGAPDLLDGELTMLDGKAYQTKSTGETVVLEDEHKTSFSSVTFFKSDTTFFVKPIVEHKILLEQIAQSLKNKNAMYAIKITGNFDDIKTRAFPPVKTKPFPKLATILEKQQFFEYENTAGTLIGYYFPEYLNGINVSGFHFHFLSDDKKQSGHVLDLTAKNLIIEIAELKGFDLDIPSDKDFQNFKFNTKDHEGLKRVEQGK
ncbi:acetolactate decarboxylase [Flavobacterium sp.]|uniref:acetolactate decarboxylase n=1 Tax=Flavobacterium sp. TaxID=239 RepID=UPI003D11712E